MTEVQPDNSILVIEVGRSLPFLNVTQLPILFVLLVGRLTWLGKRSAGKTVWGGGDRLSALINCVVGGITVTTKMNFVRWA